MKDQYVGDISDYIKYSLLRAVQQTHLASLVVCWMRTAPDTRRDGLRLGYLTAPAIYRPVDPQLFDALGELTTTGHRTTAAIESSGILGNARFVRTLLRDDAPGRQELMLDLWREVRRGDVVFFDPDNGLSVASVQLGRAGSSRYLYDSELEPLQELQASVVVYQHFPRVARKPYVLAQLCRLQERLPGYGAFAVHSSHVAFLVATPAIQSSPLQAGVRLSTARWNGRLAFTESPPLS
jgi:hypothetical protein